MTDLISIIIPCYNAEKTLAQTLESVREQVYTNLEIIIVDDGSRDDTYNVAMQYALIDSRIQVIKQENSGVSVARNNGLKHATGRYIMFLDADDNYTTPYSIKNMYENLIKADADMSVCAFTHPAFEQYTASGIYDLTNPVTFLKYYQDFFAFGMPWNKIAKRECYTDEFVPGVKFNEDELFNLDNLKNIKKVVVTSEEYHNYYCAPYDPNAPMSAVNSLYSQDNFWEKKCTVWPMGMKNHEYRLQSIKKNYPDKFVDMQYVRSFDFFFWDIAIMIKNRVKEEYVTKVCKSIFDDELFKASMKDKERYGLKLRDFTDVDIDRFVMFAYFVFIDIKSYNKKLSMYKVMLSIFTHFFYETTDNLNTVDIAAECAYNLKDNTSAEAFYVNSIFKRVEVRDEMYAIQFFKKHMERWVNGRKLKENVV